MITRWMALLFCLMALSGLVGCATSDPDQESDLPWNMPQAWENTPGIPGLEAR